MIITIKTTRGGVDFVFVKDFQPQNEDGDDDVHEAKSLNVIRIMLENLKDQLEFFHVIFLN